MPAIWFWARVRCSGVGAGLASARRFSAAVTCCGMPSKPRAAKLQSTSHSATMFWLASAVMFDRPMPPTPMPATLTRSLGARLAPAEHVARDDGEAGCGEAGAAHEVTARQSRLLGGACVAHGSRLLHIGHAA